MAKIDITYHNLLEKILQEGYTYEDPNRKGVNRLEIPSYTFRHEFKNGFPAITTKKLNYKSVVTELIWFLRGDTNIKYLIDNGCNIWNKDAYSYYIKEMNLRGGAILDIKEYIRQIKDSGKLIYHGFEFGNLGPIYGKQWREIYDKKADDIFKYDQIKTLINNLKNKPLGTQHIVNSWNVSELDDIALPPCHYGFQIVVRPLDIIEQVDILRETQLEKPVTASDIEIKGIKYGFELHWQQRSVDTFLGLPFNIASYATLALILEKITGYKALAIQGDLKKVHLYDNSFDAVKEQLSRDVDKYDKCELTFNSKEGNSNEILLKSIEIEGFDKCINQLYIEGFKLENYESYPGIRVEMLERDE